MKSNLFLRVIIVLLLMLGAFPVRAGHISPDTAREWADKNGRLLLETFREPDLRTRYDKLDDLFVRFVDLDYVSKFVMGKYWRQMTPQQRETYRGIFKRYALATYKSFPLDFVNSLTYTVGNAVEENDFTIVSATVTVTLDAKTGPQDFLLQFRLHDNGGQIQLVDIKLAESSLILSFRGQFYSQLAELEGEIEWFLEDFETSTYSLEYKNRGKLGFGQ